MSKCRVFSCVVGRGWLLWPVHCLGKTLLAFALLCFLLQGQISRLLKVSHDFLLWHSSPLWWKGHFFGVLVLEGLVGLHRTIQLQLLQHYWSEHRLGLVWYWILCLGNEQRSFCHFWDWIQALHFRLICWLWWLPHFFQGIIFHSGRYSGHLSSFTHSSSVQFSRSVVSDSLQPHELQHTRPPCPSLTPGVHSDSRPSSQWCHPAISSSVVPFYFPQSLPASESFPMSQLSASRGQSTGVSALASFLPKKSQGWSPSEWTS